MWLWREERLRRSSCLLFVSLLNKTKMLSRRKSSTESGEKSIFPTKSNGKTIHHHVSEYKIISSLFRFILDLVIVAAVLVIVFHAMARNFYWKSSTIEALIGAALRTGTRPKGWHSKLPTTSMPTWALVGLSSEQWSEFKNAVKIIEIQSNKVFRLKINQAAIATFQYSDSAITELREHWGLRKKLIQRIHSAPTQN